MGLFSKILEKLGIKKDKQAGATATVPEREKPAAPKVAAPAKPAPTSRTASTPKPAPVPAAAPAPTPISEVDVVSKLEGLAAKNPAKLNWKVSIVDLLKLLDLESSFEARKEMAVELGCPPELMNDSAKMNTWLHKKVLQEIAENGGNIPKELLD
jgi:Domain of unknown function (DUF3597)